MPDGPYSFHVQAYNVDGGLLALDEGVEVDALSAVQAAELVLGEALVPHGPASRIRARVWRIGEDFNPIVTTLYTPSDELNDHG